MRGSIPLSCLSIKIWCWSQEMGAHLRLKEAWKYLPINLQAVTSDGKTSVTHKVRKLMWLRQSNFNWTWLIAPMLRVCASSEFLLLCKSTSIVCERGSESCESCVCVRARVCLLFSADFRRSCQGSPHQRTLNPAQVLWQTLLHGMFSLASFHYTVPVSLPPLPHLSVPRGCLCLPTSHVSRLHSSLNPTVELPITGQWKQCHRITTRTAACQKINGSALSRLGWTSLCFAFV